MLLVLLLLRWLVLAVLRTEHNVARGQTNDADDLLEASAAVSAAHLTKRLNTPFYSAMAQRVERKRKRFRSAEE